MLGYFCLAREFINLESYESWLGLSLNDYLSGFMLCFLLILNSLWELRPMGLLKLIRGFVLFYLAGNPLFGPL